jgi:Restriction endonuclease
VATGVSADLLARLLIDPQEILRLTPEQFEELIADRLSAMRYEVTRIGKINRADGGVDIIFNPKPGDGLPFYGAVQSKSSTTLDPI